MLAADMGARVVKIEHPERGDDTRAWGPPFQDGESTYYLSVNRNKESVALDFKRPEGRRLLDALIDRADVVVENFRPGALARLGLDYPALSARRPSIILVSISGFGQTGPRRQEGGYDAVAQAEGGLMSVTGEAGGPAVRLGVAIADIAAGMFAFQGLLLALIARAASGRGQHVDVGLLDAVAALLTYQASRFLATGESPARAGNRHLTIAPYDTLEAADGVLVLAVGNDQQWQRFCAALDRTDLASDDRFRTNASRTVNYAVLRPLLAEIIRTRQMSVLVPMLRNAGVPCGAVRSVGDALSDPQILARGMVETVDHPLLGALRVLGIPTKLSATPGSVRRHPPLLGEHTREVLTRDLGLDVVELAELESKGIVRTLRRDVQ
jgi:crotonobetainyl-CoA:carnitine CoA-transferase CaiB-like acyl-CoA transferase